MRGDRKKLNRISPSTKSRWLAKLRIIKQLLKIIPITVINVEDIKARSKEDKVKWNKSFSPLEVGKKWFYNEINNLGVKLIKTEGYTTKLFRDNRGFIKSKSKLDYKWEAHNIDSHILCEISLDKNIQPYYGLWKIEFLEYYRRQLHVQNPIKGNIRKLYGSTVSLGLPRGGLAKYKDKLIYLGGTSKGKIAIHSIITGKRVKQHVNKGDIKMLYTTKWRMQLLPRLSKSWVSLHIFS